MDSYFTGWTCGVLDHLNGFRAGGATSTEYFNLSLRCHFFYSLYWNQVVSLHLGANSKVKVFLDGSIV